MPTDYKLLLEQSQDRAIAGGQIGQMLELSDHPNAFNGFTDVLEKSALVNIANQMRFDDNITKETALRLLVDHIVGTLDGYCATINRPAFDDIASKGAMRIEDVMVCESAGHSTDDIEKAKTIGENSRGIHERQLEKIKTALNMDGG